MKNKNNNFKNQLESQYSIILKAREKEQTRRNIIILSILIMSFISSIIGTIFAYKAYLSTKQFTNMKKQEEKINYKILTVTYNNDSTLNLTQIKTNYNMSIPKIIKITNTSEEEQIFSLKIKSIETNLLNINNLKYELSSNKGTKSGALPEKESYFIKNQTINPKETITYTLNIKYDGQIPKLDIEFKYSANLEINQEIEQTNLLK